MSEGQAFLSTTAIHLKAESGLYLNKKKVNWSFPAAKDQCSLKILNARLVLKKHELSLKVCHWSKLLSWHELHEQNWVLALPPEQMISEISSTVGLVLSQ